MANPYDSNPFGKQYNREPRRVIPGAEMPRPLVDIPGPVKKQGIDVNTGLPYNYGPAEPVLPPGAQRNPYARWATWQQPTDETSRMYYTNEQPRVAYQQFQGAWGSPNGNLQKFIDSQFGQVWADYIKQTELAKQGGGPGVLFPDVLTKKLGDNLQNQWQGQTAYQRGENYGTMGAGRRT